MGCLPHSGFSQVRAGAVVSKQVIRDSLRTRPLRSRRVNHDLSGIGLHPIGEGKRLEYSIRILMKRVINRRVWNCSKE